MLLFSIITNPKEDKFRRIKRSNAAIQKKIFSVTNILVFLITAGYEVVSYIYILSDFKKAID